MFDLLIVLSFIVKKSDMYTARCFVLWVFTSLFYEHNLYTVFAFLLWVLVVVSSYYLKVKNKVVIKGIVLGVVSSLVSYYLAPLIPSFY